MSFPSPEILYATDPGSIRRAALLLGNGGVVVIPTDTVYGLAASVFQVDAIERIFTIKQRSPEAAVPLLLASGADLSLLVSSIPSGVWALIDAFWPGPLTLVLPARPSVPRVVTGGSGTVAVRVPGARTTLQLLATLGVPVVGTSANIHGQPPCRSADEALHSLGSGVDAILVDDSATGDGQPSTVVELREDECMVHRTGAISADALRAAVGMRVRIIA